jgi:uncharacterized protein (DUF58 family)
MSDPVQVHPTLDDLVRLQFETSQFSLLPRQPVDSLLSGRHASRLRGRGLTFEELREYREGDDIRSIDWKASARLRKTHVRVYSEERERPVLFLVDQRNSMFFGSARATKATAAAEAAALGAWRTLQTGDRVGAVIFGDTETVTIKPHRSRTNVLRICHELVRINESLSAESPPTNDAPLNEALKKAINLAPHDYLVVLITDYHGNDEETRRLATTLAAHNDVIAILTYDPLGIQLPSAPDLEVFDGESRVTVPQGKSFDESFQSEFQNRLNTLKDQLASLRIPIMPICTHDPVTEQVISALGHH